MFNAPLYNEPDHFTYTVQGVILDMHIMNDEKEREPCWLYLPRQYYGSNISYGRDKVLALVLHITNDRSYRTTRYLPTLEMRLLSK